MKRTELNLDPIIYTIDQFITPEQCSHFIEISRSKMDRALVAGAKSGMVSEGRSGMNCWLLHDNDKTTKEVADKIANLIGLPLENAEAFQVIYYDVNQEYRRHFDGWLHDGSEKTHRNMKYGGQRLWTALVYLNTVSKGGCTRFTNLNMQVTAEEGRILVFQNVHGGSNNRHYYSEHCGMPIIEGEKFAFNLWFRESTRNKLYKEINPGYYLTSGLENNTEPLKNESDPEIVKCTIFRNFLGNSLLERFLDAVTACNFDMRESYSSTWIKRSNLCALINQLSTKLDVPIDFFDNFNVLRYPARANHGKHFDAFDINDTKHICQMGSKGQRVFTVGLCLTSEIKVCYPHLQFSHCLKAGDLFIRKNICDYSYQRDANLSHTIQNLKDEIAYYAIVYIRAYNQNSESLPSKSSLIQKIVKDEEDYTSTLNKVYNMFGNIVDSRWPGYKSFKYSFKGNFDYFKSEILAISELRNRLSLVNLTQMHSQTSYCLDKDLPLYMVNNVLNDEFLDILVRYYRKTIKNGTWILGDRQSHRYKAHNEPMSRFVQYELVSLISKIVGRSVRPTYTYLSAYVKGADLPGHTDREDCEYTASLVIDKPPATNWNIYIHKKTQNSKGRGRCQKNPPIEECIAADCDAGGIMIFQGRDRIHFRERLEHDYYTILLLHYRPINS